MKLTQGSLLLIAALLSPLSAFAGDTWTEVKSPHFTVITDGGEKRGRDTAFRFEQMRAGFGAVVGAKAVNVPTPVQILAFKNSKGLREVAPLFKGKAVELAGLYEPGDDEQFIAVDLSGEEHWQTVFHEYTHLLLHSNFPPTPPWFDEGFAEYYSTFQVMGKTFRIGSPPENRGAFLNSFNLLPTVQLLSVQHGSEAYNKSGETRQMFYAESWMMVHYIYDSGKMKQAVRYFDLTRKDKMPVEDAFQQAFGMTTKKWDGELRAYLGNNQVKALSFTMPEVAPASTYRAREISELDSQVAIADMHFHSADHRGKAEDEYRAVLAQQPDNVRANRGLGYAALMHGEYEKAEHYFAKVAETDQQDPMLHYYYAMLLMRSGAGDAREKIVKQAELATKLNPELADAYNIEAIANARAHDYAAAEEAMGKALKLKPNDPRYQANLAGFYLSDHKVGLAKSLFQALTQSDEPTVAMNAQRSLESINNMSADEQDVEVNTSDDDRPVLLKKAGEKSSGIRVVKAEDEDDGVQVTTTATQPTAPPPSATVSYVRGVLTSVECGSPAATLTVVTDHKRTLKLQTQDWKKTIVFGADQVSCEWKNKKVSVNYRAGGEADGVIVALSLLE